MVIAVLAGAACLTPWVGPPIALAMGIAIALTGLTPAGGRAGKLAKIMIQVGVVLLGFRMDLAAIRDAGVLGVAFAVGTIALTLTAGFLLAKMLRVDRTVSALVSNGTAICGGSAIAATGPMINATASQMAVAMGSVFLLNAIGLFIFPPLGRLLDLTPDQFGTWAAIAVHDVSSVVGSAAAYDRMLNLDAESGSLGTATTVKLSRALWIAPVALLAGWMHRRAERRAGIEHDPVAAGRLPIPWFIGLFVLASVARTVSPQIAELAPNIEPVAKKVLTIALLLIGMGLSIKALRSVGWRALVLAVALWILISTVSLVIVLEIVE